jgi:hypothetical protein
VVDLNPAFGQQLFDVSVRQAIAQVPTHRHGNHLWRKPELGEAGPRRWQPTVTTTHQHSLPEPAIDERNSASDLDSPLIVFIMAALAHYRGND